MSNTIGWGRGASNNSIGWGNVGTNGFGSIYNRSNSGETILKDPNFIIEVDTSIAGATNTDQFQFTGAVGEYDVEAYQNDSLVASFNDLVNEQTITLPSAGIYELRVIPKPEGFDKLKFNNGGDKDKLLEVLQWGLYGVNEPDQSFAFFGCTNNTEIADGGAWFDVVTNGFVMFFSNSLTSLPTGMNLPNLSDGGFMFQNNFLTSLPAGMELPNLTFGMRMFQNNSLTSLPADMELPNLPNGFAMFRDNLLTSLPSGMELPNLSDGGDMFRNNLLTSLPSGMELPNLTNVLGMFQNNFLTSLPAGMELPNLTNGSLMFLNNTLNTERYSQLLIDLEEFNPNNNVAFHGGNSQYNAQGEIARNLLISRGWTITDGGAENVFQTATVAYSLRDLGLGATNVVRVRRDSDNAEQDFTATEITDGSLTTFCGAGDGFVSIWYDQTGANNAIQTTAISQPIIVTAGALILEGNKPTLSFSNDSLNSEEFNVMQPFSFLLVVKITETNSIVYDKSVTGSVRSFFYLSGTPLLQINSGSNLSSSDNFLNTRFQFTNIHNSNNSSISINSSLNVSGNVGTNGISSLNIGATSTRTLPLSGNIQEIICFNNDLNGIKTTLETNINNYYAIY